MRKSIFGACFIGLLTTQLSFAFPAKFGLSPDNNTQLLVQTLESAKRRILINIYQFDADYIADAIVERIEKGVVVELLVDGMPVGGMSDEGRDTLLRIRDAMTESRKRGHRLFVMTRTRRDIPKRFVYNHAKYVIVDSTQVLVSSENFTSNGHAAPGKTGNRGWEVSLTDPGFAKTMTDLFQEDSSLAHGDVVRIGPRDSIPEPVKLNDDADSGVPIRDAEEIDFEIQDQTDQTIRERIAAEAPPSMGIGSGTVRRARLMTSPNALPPLKALIGKARKSLRLEQMSFPSTWKNPDGTIVRSGLVQAVIDAARRGARVNALLNDEWAFNPGAPRDPAKKKANEITVDLLNDLARCYDLPMEARLIDVKAVGVTYIHNKGILVDDDQALVSSINGTRNSIVNNREVAVLLDSRDAVTYYSRAFYYDWNKSKEFNKKARGRNAEGDCPPLEQDDLNPDMAFRLDRMLPGAVY